jgi:hypothetical protein
MFKWFQNFVSRLHKREVPAMSPTAQPALAPVPPIEESKTHEAPTDVASDEAPIDEASDLRSVPAHLLWVHRPPG